MLKNARKLIIVGITTLCLLLTIIPASVGTASAFKDVTQTHWANNTIEWAVQQGIVDGYTDETFKPERAVTEPEFLAMLFRAYPNIVIPKLNANDAWYQPYFSLGVTYNWPIWYESNGGNYDRGRVAQVLAATQGEILPTRDAVQYTLDYGMANGKTSATVDGFGIQDKLTRAQAITLIKNMKDNGLGLTKGIGKVETILDDGFLVSGITIGSSEESVIARLGQPVSKELSKYGFQWYIYHDNYKNYLQVGVNKGKVVGLYTNSTNWASKEDITLGTAAASLKKAYGDQLTYLQKGNTRYSLTSNSLQEAPMYLIDGSYVTFFLDKHKSNTITAVQLIEQNTELSLAGYYGKESAELEKSFEQQVFDLTNATRVRFGLDILKWDELAVTAARKHSKDMALNNFFSHTNLSGESPFDRMNDEGIHYRYASENIAAGQTSAIFAHESWMNSIGHREGILNENAKRLGVGIYMGGSMQVYYTENFYSPK